MRYLISHYDTFYYRRKLQYKNICISLKTKNKLEAKYILSIINSKLEIMRDYMDFTQEIEYIKKLLKQYVDTAKEEYSHFATNREHKYQFTKPSGKVVLGSHPQAIEYHIEELQDSVYSNDKQQVTEDIINDSNIKEDYKQALKELSTEGQQRLLDEVIKAEIELLHYDKERNDRRTDPAKLTNTYIENDIYTSNTISTAPSGAKDILKAIKEVKEEEQQKFKLKTKQEVFEEYFEQEKEAKASALDKFVLPIQILLQSAEHKYLVDYDLKDFERFFNALIYVPGNAGKKKKLFEDYDKNYVQIAEDYKETLEGEEDLFKDYEYKLKLQSVSNVSEKLDEFNNFIRFCKTNNYIENNYMTDNSKFSKKRFKNILADIKKREPFNRTELQNMFKGLNNYVNQKGFRAEEIYIPLIGLYSGMRVEEICKLRIEDIKQEDDIYYFDINEDNGNVKTEDSIRKVPIHKDLIEKFNFIHYVEIRKNKKEEMLFNLKTVFHKKRIKYNHYFLRDFFADFRDSFVSQERREENLISFHSYRHSFASRLLESRVEFYTISTLLGHKVDSVLKNLLQVKIKPNETSRYAKHYTIDILKEDIDKLNLSDIEDSINTFEKTFKKCFRIGKC